MLNWQLGSLAGRMSDPLRGRPLLEETEHVWSALVPPTRPVFAHALRLRAGFNVLRQAYDEADHALEQALNMLKRGVASPVDLAVARSELAELRTLELRPTEA